MSKLRQAFKYALTLLGARPQKLWRLLSSKGFAKFRQLQLWRPHYIYRLFYLSYIPSGLLILALSLYGMRISQQIDEGIAAELHKVQVLLKKQYQISLSFDFDGHYLFHRITLRNVQFLLNTEADGSQPLEIVSSSQSQCPPLGGYKLKLEIARVSLNYKILRLLEASQQSNKWEMLEAINLLQIDESKLLILAPEDYIPSENPAWGLQKVQDFLAQLHPFPIKIKSFQAQWASFEQRQQISASDLYLEFLPYGEDKRSRKEPASPNLQTTLSQFLSAHKAPHSNLLFYIRAKVQSDLHFGQQASQDDKAFLQLRSNVSFHGWIDHDLSQLDAISSVEDLRSNYADIPSLSFHIRYREDSLSLQALNKIETLDWQLDYLFSEKSINLALWARAFHLKEMANAHQEQLQAISQDQIDGFAQLSFKIPQRSLDYAGDLELRLLRSRTLVALKGQGDLEQLQVERMELLRPKLSVQFQGDLPYKSLLPSGRVDLRVFSGQAKPSADSDILQASFLLQREGSRLRLSTPKSLLFQRLKPHIEGLIRNSGARYHFDFNILFRQSPEELSQATLASNQGSPSEEFWQTVFRLEGDLARSPKPLLQAEITSVAYDRDGILRYGFLDVKRFLRDTNTDNLEWVFPKFRQARLLLNSSFRSDFQSFNYKLRHLEISGPGIRRSQENITVRADISPQSLEIQEMNILWDTLSLANSMSVQLQRGQGSGEAYIQGQSIAYEFQARQGNWSIQGDYGLNAYWRANNFGLNLDQLPLPNINSYASNLSVALKGSIDRDYWAHSTINIENLVWDFPSGGFFSASPQQYELSASWQGDVFSLQRLAFVEEDRSLVGSGLWQKYRGARPAYQVLAGGAQAPAIRPPELPFVPNPDAEDDEEYWAGDFHFQSTRQENLNFNLSLRGQDLRIESSGLLESNRFPLAINNGFVSFQLNSQALLFISPQFADTKFRLQQVQGRAEILQASLQNRKLRFSTNIDWQDNNLLFSDIQSQWGVLNIQRSFVSLQSRQKLKGLISYQLKLANGNDYSSTLVLDLSSQQNLTQLLSWEGSLYSYPVRETRPNLSSGINPSNLFQTELNTTREIYPAVQLFVDSDGESLEIYQRDRDLLDILLRQQSFSVYISTAYPISLEAAGQWSEGHVLAQIRNISILPELLNAMVPHDPILKQSIIKFSGGQIIGNLSIEGPLLNPNIDGALAMQDINVALPYFPNEVPVLNAVLRAKGHIIAAEPFSLEFSKGQLFFPGREEAYIRHEYLLVKHYYLGFESGGREGIPLFYDAYGMRLQTNAIASGTLQGDDQSGRLDAQITLNNLIFTGSTQNNRLVRSTSSSNGYRFSVNIRNIIGRNATLAYPQLNNPIIKAKFKPQEVIQVNYDSDKREGSLDGLLTMDQGSLYILGNELQLQHGELRFQENFRNFSPDINLSYRLFTQDSFGQGVQISLNYEGELSRLTSNDFRPVIVSEPKLPESQLRFLIAESFNKQGNFTNTFLPGVLSQLGNSIVIAPLEQLLRNQLNLDEVQIKTDALSKILNNYLGSNGILGSNSKGDNNQENSSPGSALRYFDQSRFSFGRYLNEDNSILLSFNVDLYYKPEDTSNVLFMRDGLQIVPGLGLSFRTPFASIGWNIGFSHIDQFFIPDNTLSVELPISTWFRKKKQNTETQADSNLVPYLEE